MRAGDAGTKTRAAGLLAALPDTDKESTVTRLLGALGAHREALRIVEKKAMNESFSAASLLWYPSMRGALRDPAFPALVQRLGLINYWRATHIKPDACRTRDVPAFCNMI
jgi:hypothetical protein